MNFLLDFPRLKAYCQLKYLTAGTKTGWIACYVFAVTLIESRPLLFTIHTEDGAIYSRIPLWALTTTKVKSHSGVDRWGSISGSGTVVQHAYLKDYEVEHAWNGPGRYWATIDFNEGGFAQDPEQHKTANILLMANGHIMAVPNNECLFLDRHFTEKQKWPKHYRRNSNYYTI